jgi:hypothetical protein
MDLKKLVEKKTTGQAAGDKKKPQASDSHKENPDMTSPRKSKLTGSSDKKKISKVDVKNQIVTKGVINSRGEAKTRKKIAKPGAIEESELSPVAVSTKAKVIKSVPKVSVNNYSGPDDSNGIRKLDNMIGYRNVGDGGFQLDQETPSPRRSRSPRRKMTLAAASVGRGSGAL